MERYRVTIDVAAWSHSSACSVAAKMLLQDPSRWAKVELVDITTTNNDLVDKIIEDSRAIGIPRSFEESYQAIRAAGGDAWDGLDVAKELAEMRGYDVADEEAESK
jgi:hypothetical protein